MTKEMTLVRSPVSIGAAAGCDLRLERSGYAVIAANDGLEALQLATECRPDLVILDVTMPGLTGVEVTRALRARDESVPVILLTAHANDADVDKGGDAGADVYVTKPFSPQELESRVRALTECLTVSP